MYKTIYRGYNYNPTYNWFLGPLCNYTTSQFRNVEMSSKKETWEMAFGTRMRKRLKRLRHPVKEYDGMYPLKINMALENPHFQ